jgi:hypothetical protein
MTLLRRAGSRLAACVIAFGVCAGVPGAAAGETMRLDLYHTGTRGSEIFAVDEVLLEPLPWPGNPNRPLDDSNRGEYLFEVLEPATGEAVYSRGFSSIFEEWQSTAEAEDRHRTFHESLRFPAPAGPVVIRILRRDAANAFAEIWRTTIDPDDMLVDRAPRAPRAPVIPIQQRGDPAHKVDLLILGDGYTAGELGRFEADARRGVEALFAKVPDRSAVGAFEGAYYSATGYYRPALECLMFTRSRAFCPVCAAAVEATIDLYTAPAEASDEHGP